MNFAFSDDQEFLRVSAHRILARESTSSTVRRCWREPDAWRQLWTALVDLGWNGLTIPEACGGLGLGTVDLVGLLEITGQHLLPVPLLSTVGLALPLLRGGGAAADTLLEEVAGGATATGAMPWSRPGSVPGESGPLWDGAHLRGEMAHVADGSRAELIAAVARHADGAAVVAVVRPGPAVRITPSESVDPNRPMATVTLDGVGGSDVTILDYDPVALDAALTAVAAELVGVADRALTAAVDHARLRHQFGRPIGAFQGVKHRLSDGYVLLERARSLTYYAAMLLDDPGSPAGRRSMAAALAKAAAGDAAVTLARYNIQIHGAIGVTGDHDAHLLLRRARAATSFLGGSQVQYVRAAELFVTGGDDGHH